MNRKLAVAVGAALTAVAIGATPAAADTPTFGCYTNGGSLIFEFASSPGDLKWLTDVQACQLVKGGAHPEPLRKS